MANRRWLFATALLSSATTLVACGGGGGDGAALAPPAPVPAPAPAPAPAPVVLPPLIADAPLRISAATPFNGTCTGAQSSDIVYINAEVEPSVAVNPRDPNNWVASWQQDRWSGGSANGIVTATTVDGGITWTRIALPFTRCAGGTPTNGGDYERATDPWVSFAPDGTVHQMALAVAGASFSAGSANAMLASRSTDGGRTWSAATTLIRDGAAFFNDKNSITADPTDSRYVYAAWDRLAAAGGGPFMLARSTDGGLTWEAARAIHDPGARGQTIGALVGVLPNGTVIALFTRLDTGPNGQTTASLHVLSSADKGVSWTGPFRVADVLAVGARDPASGQPIRDGATLGSLAVAPNGTLWVAWQDARFSGGARDGIAIARSTDGGQTWSTPAQVNATPAAQAFTPAVHVTANGTIGVTWFDLRNDSAATAALETEFLIARSADGSAWTEHRAGTTFNLLGAPYARGYFLGDYQGLASANNVFLSVHARTTGDAANSTDVFALAARSLPAVAVGAAPVLPQRAIAPGEPSPDFRQRVHENIVRTMERRLPGWSIRNGVAPPP